MEAASCASPEVNVWGDLGAGLKHLRWLGGRGGAGEKGAWHNATPAVLGEGGGLTLLLDGVKFMFFLWK